MSNKAESKTMKCVFVFALYVPLALFWASYVTSVLWSWFAVPFGLPQIGLFHAVGLALLCEVLARGYTRDAVRRASANRSSLDDMIQRLAAVIVGPAVALLIGWLMHQGMTA